MEDLDEDMTADTDDLDEEIAEIEGGQTGLTSPKYLQAYLLEYLP